MIANVSKAGALILPHNMGDEFHSYTGTFPEWMILTPSILGLILSVLEKNKRKAILFPLCFTSIGIILSNPTPWRMNIFGFLSFSCRWWDSRLSSRYFPRRALG
jgi:hypothetical protein